ncbi:alcohol dehydrogenase catalytic domain-containing protein [Alicyclobacillus dauci]|uniref:Alcohol dehydrogenase catalytic domain-containing protein n=1 Tax=Alicyclobacillus dauci TaxID=1475485 RepID=A0ABY6YYR7_9BACL|nr:alcohol dehydrogenase catalytic domain-containing protein [Alicyclobacillus dauci]WAH35589.1 alcohol dehydrogenase catalytic domain-containing protein [Alicyclobacillus dauci]
MKAVTFQGLRKIEVKDVPDPIIQNPDDIIVKITSTAIGGSDLHAVHGMTPYVKRDDILGCEAMGIVEAVGKSVTRVQRGDRVVIPCHVACGECRTCRRLQRPCVSTSDAGLSDELDEHDAPRAMIGHGVAGQAEYVRVPYGNFAPYVLPQSCELPDEHLLFLSDILPTAFWGVEEAGVKRGDTVVVLGCGPLGLLVHKLVWLKRPKRVLAVDYIEYRLAHAHIHNNVETINFTNGENTGELLRELTLGGADVVIDCVGMDGKKTLMERTETNLKIQSGTLSAIHTAARATRRGGTIQLLGTYGTRYNAFPLGDMYTRNITLKMGLAPVVHYMPRLFSLLESQAIDPTDVITHRVPLSDAKHAYEVFDAKMDNCIKVILKP